MEVILVGNIASAISAHIAESLGDAVEEDVLKGVVKEVIPDCGMVIASNREELSNLGNILYTEVEVKPKEGQ